MKAIFKALDIEADFQTTGSGNWPSLYSVSDLASNSVAAVGIAMSELIFALGLSPIKPGVSVDRHLASHWFSWSLKPVDWQMPPAWDNLAGDYCTFDGWIRLHTNLPHHRAAALRVLGCADTREAVADEIAGWVGNRLENAIVAEGGVAAVMRSRAEWLTHPQGAAVATEPLIDWTTRSGQARDWLPTNSRPLAGLRVLDLTRVLAGPVATRTLAGFGADVLRIDPPGWDEANVIPEITLGKRCATLDLRDCADLLKLENLLESADILVHGYRPGALEALGLDLRTRRSLAPHLIEVCLDAYGWTGPWADRRGFDSLVQMSSGIAHAGMRWADTERPTPLPVQALDHATGYMMAAAVLSALRKAVDGEGIASVRLSLARTAELLVRHLSDESSEKLAPTAPDDYSPILEETPWGPGQRLVPPVKVAGTEMRWDRPAATLGSFAPVWL